jgi:CheY-like chemotaxis protein
MTRILVVDDEKDIREVLTYNLGQAKPFEGSDIVSSPRPKRERRVRDFGETS